MVAWICVGRVVRIYMYLATEEAGGAEEVKRCLNQLEESYRGRGTVYPIANYGQGPGNLKIHIIE